MEKPGRLTAGTVLGGFRIVRKIDEGGMGEVYEAFDDALGRRIAIKVLNAEALGEAEALSRFKSEGRALAQLNHPNVVKLHVVGQTDQMHFMAMEFIDGQTLDRHLFSHNCNLPQLMDLFKQIVDGLAVAHDVDIVHRDIKPQNVMVTRSGRVKLVDFGIAKAQTEHDNYKTSTGIVLGTRSFLAPEVLRGLPATKQADIYSLGLLLKFMLTGEMPQISPNNTGLTGIAKAGPSLLFPKALTYLLQGMCQPSKEMRYKTLAEVTKDINAISFKDFHPDLLAVVPHSQKIENLSVVYDRCRQRGLDLTESRMVVSLAAKITGPLKIQAVSKTGPIDNTTKKIDVTGKIDITGKIEEEELPPLRISDEAIGKATVRVKQAKTIVLSGRVGGAQTIQVKVEPHSTNRFFASAFFIVIIVVSMIKIFAPDRFDEVVAYFTRITEDVQRSAASILPPPPTEGK